MALLLALKDWLHQLARHINATDVEATLNFSSYLLIKIVGAEHGVGLSGLLGGLASSTAVTLGFSQRSRQTNADASALALGDGLAVRRGVAGRTGGASLSGRSGFVCCGRGCWPDRCQTLTRFFDEPPTPQSLAGYIAARYTSEVLGNVEGALTRQTALLAFQQRQVVDLNGFRVSFNAQGRGGSYVTQSMITPDGRLVG